MPKPANDTADYNEPGDRRVKARINHKITLSNLNKALIRTFLSNNSHEQYRCIREQAIIRTMNRDQFSRFEERIEQLVEGSFARLFGSRLHPREVAVRLTRAVEDNVRQVREGYWEAPNLFTVCFNPADAKALLDDQPDLSNALAETVIDLANRADLRLNSFPIIQLCDDETVALHDIQITARHNMGEVRSTQLLASLTPPVSEDEPSKPANPHLILHGNRTVPLERAVVNIGRRGDNHVVINDSRVSRSHAQIRLRFGRYVLYDLGSTGGTYVNNHRITEVILRPGDVISLAGVTLVYVEDDVTSRGASALTDTQMRPPTSSGDDSNA